MSESMSESDNVRVEIFCGQGGNSDNVESPRTDRWTDGHTETDTGANQYQRADAADKYT